MERKLIIEDSFEDQAEMIESSESVQMEEGEAEEEAKEDEEEEENYEDTEEEGESKLLNPVASAGDYVVISKIRSSSASNYRFIFTNEMLENYGGKVLIVLGRTLVEEESVNLEEDDGYQYTLMDVYGRVTPFVWASSMFTVVPSHRINQAIVEGCSTEIIAFNNLLKCYLTCKEKVGAFNGPYHYIVYRDGVWAVIKSEWERGLFAFHDEDSATHFLKENIEDFVIIKGLYLYENCGR